MCDKCNAKFSTQARFSHFSLLQIKKFTVGAKSVEAAVSIAAGLFVANLGAYLKYHFRNFLF
jgi:hypothetical protein